MHNPTIDLLRRAILAVHDNPSEALRLIRLAEIRLEQPSCDHPECHPAPVERPYDPAERGSWSPCVCWLDPVQCAAHDVPEAVLAARTTAAVKAREAIMQLPPQSDEPGDNFYRWPT